MDGQARRPNHHPQSGARKLRDRRGEVLFIDARNMGTLVDRTRREHHPYEDIPGFCKSAKLEEIRKHGHVLTPGRYVGAAAQEDGGEPFEDKMRRLSAQWREQQQEAVRLDAAIQANLKVSGF